jgi:hypothetical protein
MRAAIEPQRHAPRTVVSEPQPAGGAKPTTPNCYERVETTEHAEATVRATQSPPVCERVS